MVARLRRLRSPGGVVKFAPPIRRVDTAKGHHYKDAEGRRVPGVTTIIGVGHARAYSQFLVEFDVDPVHVEFSVASYRYGYAGTGDLIAKLTFPGIGRILALCDVKTNRSGIFGETALQLAAYRYADVLIKDGEQPMPEVDACFAIHVGPDFCRLVPVTADLEQHRSFLYAQQVAEFVKVSNDLIGPAVQPPTTATFRLVRDDT
jgi:hypothetical protein